MEFKTKIEIEKCVYKIINRVDMVQKYSNFSNLIHDEHIDEIIKSAEKILSLMNSTEWVGYDPKTGKTIPIQ